MSVKPESQFISSVHTYVPRTIYHMKNNNPYVSGIPDVWYSGQLDLWAEYKFLPRTPSRGIVVPKLSVLQLNWLEGRYAEGRSIAVIIGCPDGGVVLDDPRKWKDGIEASSFRERLLTRRQIAEWIVEKTTR